MWPASWDFGWSSLLALSHICPPLGQSRDMTERKKIAREGHLTSWDHRAECPYASQFCSYRFLLQLLFPPLKYCLGAQMQENGKKGKNTKRWFLKSIWTLNVPFPAPGVRNREVFLKSSLAAPCAHFQISGYT